jgi:hypothetical protein
MSANPLLKASLAASSVGLPLWVERIQNFQQMGLINKALTEIVGVDVPKIALAKNPDEQKERIFRQTVLFLLAFAIAPLHSIGLTRIFARQLLPKAPKLGQTLMRLSFEELQSEAAFKKGLKRLFSKTEPLPQTLKHLIEQPNTKAFRQKIIGVKSNHMILDLGIEGALFGSLGFIKNWYGRQITGKNQFTGERKLVDEKTLDAIYQHEHYTNWLDRIPYGKELFSFFAGTTITTGIATLFKQVALNPKKNKILRSLNRLLPHYEYTFTTKGILKHVPLMSTLALWNIMIAMGVGEWVTARSRRERNEFLLNFVGINFTFFAITPLLNKLMNDGCLSIGERVGKALKKGLPKAKIIEAAKQATRIFGLNYLISWVGVSGFIVLANHLTRKGVQDAAEKVAPPAVKIVRPVHMALSQNSTQSFAQTFAPALPDYSHSLSPAVFALPTPLASASPMATLSRLNPPPAFAAQ